MSGNTIRVLIVEDEPLYRDMLKVSLSQYPRFEIVGDYGRPEDALANVDLLRPEVAILDIELPGDMNGIQLGLSLRKRLKELGIVILSNHADPHYLSAVPRESIGGWSYLQKKSVRNIETLVRALEGAAMGLVVLDEEIVERSRGRGGGPLERLSARQREVLGLIAEGYTNAAIAEKLVLSEKSVENYINQIYQQLNVGSQAPTVHPRVTAALLYLQEAPPGSTWT